MKAKKLLLSFLLVFLCFGLFACGGIKVTITGDKQVEVGKSITLSAEAKDGASFEWFSNNEAVATVTGGTVTGVSAGNVTITVKATVGGKTAEATVVIKVVRPSTNTKPVINGVTDRTIEKGGDFNPLEGITASDAEDGDLTLKIVYSGNVKKGAIGTYDVQYSVTDNDGNTTVVTAKVYVVYTDKDAPLLTGAQSKSIVVGDTAFRLTDGVMANDSNDGDLTSNIKITGTVDPWTLGEYTVDYSVSDSAGNETKVTRKITVGLGEFQFDELAEKEFVKDGNDYKFTIALDSIDTSLSSFALGKLSFKVNAAAACELVPSATSAIAQDKIALAQGDNTVEVYFRFVSTFESGALTLAAPEGASLTFSEVKFAFGEAKDTEAPVISVPQDKEVVLPGDISDAEVLKPFVLNGVTAQDNIDGIVTSKLDVDFTGIELGNCTETKEVTIFVVDKNGNRAEVKREVSFVKVYDTKLIDEPEFNNMPKIYDAETHIGWGLNGGSGDPEIKVEDGVLIHHNTTNAQPGWDSASSPFYRTTTEYLKPYHWYLLKFDVKAAVARKMTVRIGLETTEALGWIEDFDGGSNVPFNLTTDWQTCYVLFYVHAAKSQGNMNVAKIELKVGSMTWGPEESGNTCYFDNLQIYLLSNENSAPTLKVNTDLPTTFGKGEAKPDLTKYVIAHDLEDAADIEVKASDITESLDMSKAGTYDIVYVIKDSEGKEATITLQIKVLEEKDTVAPVITEVAGINKSCDQFGAIPDLTKFVKIVDNVDGDIAVTVKMITTEADINKAGTFAVKYTVKDSSGNEAEYTLNIVINDKEGPKVEGKEKLVTTVGKALTAEDIIKEVTVTDNIDGTIALEASDVKGLDQVNFAEVGQYRINIEKSDAAGNKTTYEMVIVVKEEGQELALEIHDFTTDTLVGENAELEQSEGHLVINPSDVGQWASFAKIKISNLPVEFGKEYELAIIAKADKARKIQFNIGEALNADPWMDKYTLDVSSTAVLDLTTEDQLFTIRFMVDKPKVANGPTIEFCFGLIGGSNEEAGNKIHISRFKLYEITKEESVDKVVLDNFESYADTGALVAVWNKRYDSTNYTEGFELVTVEGNKLVKFTYAKDKKYLLRYVGDNFPKLTDDYKYIRFHAKFASEETPVEIWCYYEGGQMGYNYTPSEIYCEKDGYYYVKVSDWGKKASILNGFAIGFNYKEGSEAYFDDIEYVTTKPDTDAPVFNINESFAAQIEAGFKFNEGADLTSVYRQMRLALTATDDADGDIEITDDMIDLGGLNLTHAYAGAFKITYLVPDSAGNVAKLEIPVTIEGADGKVLDILHRGLKGENAEVVMNGEVAEINPTNVGEYASFSKMKITDLGLVEGKTYELKVTAKADEARKILFNIGIGLWAEPWMNKFKLSVEGSNTIDLTTEFVEYVIKFKYDQETKDAGPLIEFCVGKVGSEGDKVGNKIYVSALDIYTAEPDGDEEAPVITLSNEVLAALSAKKFMDGADESATFQAFLAGISIHDNKDGDIAFTNDMVNLGGLVPNALVKGDYTITITATDAAGNVGTKEVKIHVTTYANVDLLADLPTSNADYLSELWTKEKYGTDGWVKGGDMRSREKDGIRVANMANGYSMSMRWTYNKDGAALGLANKFSLKMGNYWSNAQTMQVKIILEDYSGNKTYLMGSADAFEDFAVTTSLVDKVFTFDTIDVKSVIFVTKSTVGDSTYLYIGNVVLEYVAD